MNLQEILTELEAEVAKLKARTTKIEELIRDIKLNYGQSTELVKDCSPQVSNKPQMRRNK